ncbi:MAG: DNA polymerase III subunit beta [Candidatus Cloacimonetes bacterium]|nr:DNA polymerase III subunit beta [Candidatus Cloacimonadota bacterium]
MLIQQEQIKKIVLLAKKYGATRLILFGSTLEYPSEAKDLDFACEGVLGWKLYELGAKLEEDLQISVDIVPLTPSTPFTRYIESKGKVIL